MGNLPPRGRGPKRPPRQNFRGPRRNDRIRVLEIRVLGPDGAQIGVMKTRDALELAKQAGLDLVEISPNAVPPVCRIIDYGKYAYEQSKKEKATKAKSSAGKLKEVKFRVRIEEHDYVTKMRRGEYFLDHNNKLKITLMFRGREMEHPQLGFEVVNRAVADLAHIGKPDSDPRRVGRAITLTLSPLPASKRKHRWLESEEQRAKAKIDAETGDHDADEEDEDHHENGDSDDDDDGGEDSEADADGDAPSDAEGDGSETESVGQKPE